MKNNLTLIGIFVVLIFGLIIFTGCAEKKSVVTSELRRNRNCACANTAQTTETRNNNMPQPIPPIKRHPLMNSRHLWKQQQNLLSVISTLILTVPSSVPMPVKFLRSMPIIYSKIEFPQSLLKDIAMKEELPNTTWLWGKDALRKQRNILLI